MLRAPRSRARWPLAWMSAALAISCSSSGSDTTPAEDANGVDGTSSETSTSGGDSTASNDDTGGTTDDATNGDSTVTADDTGSTTDDTGGAATDTGGTVTDTGGTATDSGSPPVDAGPAGDTGVVIPPGDTVFSIDVGKGPARQYQPPAAPVAISTYVYGINGFGTLVARGTKFGLIRKGGDQMTDWNWHNNYSNSAADYCFWQGQLDGGNAPAAEIVAASGDTIVTAAAKGEAYLATIPIVDHVSNKFDNNTGINGLCPKTAACNGNTSYGVNSGNLDFASTNPASTAFVANKSTKGSAFCTGACTGLTGTVYQDELVNFLKVNYGQAGKPPIFFSLDNEPNYWPGTHPEVFPFTGTVPCQDGTVTYDEIVNRNKDYAAAIKNAWPQAKVFAPIVAQDGVIYAHSYTDVHVATEFADYYLQQMAAASAAAGHPLLDAFDIHYYNSNGNAAQCLQSPRMFWDPNYKDITAAQTDAVDFGWSGLSNHFDTAWYPRQVIPRLLGKIAKAYPAGGTAAPGLSFSEYNGGCETAIEGGVAEADNLGIFGREGVFAATAWPLQTLTNNYLVAAFDAYRNYDGAGGVVGDLAINATTTDLTNTSVYAFAHAGTTGAVDVVAINKTAANKEVGIKIANTAPLTTAKLYHLVNGSAAVVAAGGTAPTITCAGSLCELIYTMPAKSVTTMILR